MGWVEVVAGVALVLAVFYDLFQSVVLPRPAINKFALVRYLFRAVWRTWRWVGSRMSRLARREAWLASFAPVGVALNFTVWGLALVLGYGLIIDGLRGEMRPPPPDFGTSLYFSATTFVPLSYGDIVPIGVIARLVTVAESVTGIIVAALAITLLFSLYESFQDREKLVVQLDALAGAPPSGVQILETASEHGMKDELIKTFDEWRNWAADVLESHLAYPILFFFRSSHDNEAWINSFGAVMDAATLVLSTVDDKSEGPAKLMLTVGNHLVEDLSWYFRFPHPEDPIVERSEYDEARERLKKAGYQLQPADAAWEKFARLRKKYATPLNLLARNFAIVPAEWIGDRSYLPHRERAARRPRAASGRRQPPAR
jgi:Ion channel